MSTGEHNTQPGLDSVMQAFLLRSALTGFGRQFGMDLTADTFPLDIPSVEPDAVVEEDTKPTLPEKALTEYTATELTKLNDDQIAELLFRASVFADRETSLTDFNQHVEYLIKADEERQPKTRFSNINPEQISVTELEPKTLPGSGTTFRRAEVIVPMVPYGSRSRFEHDLLPHLNPMLETLGLPPIDLFSVLTDPGQFDRLWATDYSKALKEFNYGDGGLVQKYESFEHVLAKEAQDLVDLGFEFTDIAAAVDEITTGMYSAIRSTDGQSPTTPYMVTGQRDSGSYIYLENRDNPNFKGSAKFWRFNVIRTPFKGVKYSTVDYTVRPTGKRGHVVSLSETSASLYKQHVVEGYYLPHYRISAARVVWGLGLGTPEQQAAALTRDWGNLMDGLEHAEKARNRSALNGIINYAGSYFPEDTTYWQGYGFDGFRYKDKVYPTMLEARERIIADHDHIQPPPGSVLYGVNTAIENPFSAE